MMKKNGLKVKRPEVNYIKFIHCGIIFLLTHRIDVNKMEKWFTNCKTSYRILLQVCNLLLCILCFISVYVPITIINYVNICAYRMVTAAMKLKDACSLEEKL